MNPFRWFLGGVLLATLFIAGCKPKVEPVKPDPPEVFWSHPVSREIRDYEEFTGKTDARYTVDLKANAQGFLTEVRFRDSSVVHKGEILAIIDQKPYKAAVQLAEAEKKKQEASVVKARSFFEPTEQLYLNGRNDTKQNYDSYKADLETAIAAVASAEAQLVTARLNLEYSSVVSPIEGRITRRLVDPGNYVKTGDTTLATVVSEDPMYVYFDVDERTMLKLDELSRDGKLGGSWGLERRWYRPLHLPVHLGLSNEEGFPSKEKGVHHEGIIDYVSPRVDTATGTIQMRALFPNPILNDNKRVLSPGLFARVQLPVGAPRSALLIPESALGTEQGRRYLYLLSDDEPYTDKAGKPRTKAKPTKLEVEVGTRDGDLIVIERVTNPPDIQLTADSRVIVVGLQRVQEKGDVTTTHQPGVASSAPTSPAFKPPVSKDQPASK